MWGASRPRVDSWLDGFGPFSEKGKGHVLVGSSVGCEQSMSGRCEYTELCRSQKLPFLNRRSKARWGL